MLARRKALMVLLICTSLCAILATKSTESRRGPSREDAWNSLRRGWARFSGVEECDAWASQFPEYSYWDGPSLNEFGAIVFAPHRFLIVHAKNPCWCDDVSPGTSNFRFYLPTGDFAVFECDGVANKWPAALASPTSLASGFVLVSWNGRLTVVSIERGLRLKLESGQW